MDRAERTLYMHARPGFSDAAEQQSRQTTVQTYMPPKRIRTASERFFLRVMSDPWEVGDRLTKRVIHIVK